MFGSWCFVLCSLCEMFARITKHKVQNTKLQLRLSTYAIWNSIRPMSTTTESLTGEQIVELCRKHTLFEWSIQSAVDPIPVSRSKGIYFWTPEGKRFIDFNSQLMCVNIGHGDERVINAIKQQAETLA